MIAFYSDTFVLPLPVGHRFPMEKYRLLRERVLGSPDTAHCELRIPPAATDQELTLAHTPEYVGRVSRGELTELEMKRIGFPWSPQMVERSRRSTGATIAAVAVAIEEGASVNLAGGTHHASTSAGGGYCVFNDACVAARVAQRRRWARQVLILDLDVHQGNGSAEICRGDPTIFTCSLHCDKNYPFLKAVSDWDVALPERTGDEEYLRALDGALAHIEGHFTPDLVIYLAGADPYLGDRLGKMRLTKHGLLLRDQRVFKWAETHRLPIVAAMAGGYATDVQDIVDIHHQTIRQAVEYHRRFREGCR